MNLCLWSNTAHPAVIRAMSDFFRRVLGAASHILLVSGKFVVWRNCAEGSVRNSVRERVEIHDHGLMITYLGSAAWALNQARRPSTTQRCHWDSGDSSVAASTTVEVSPCPGSTGRRNMALVCGA